MSGAYGNSTYGTGLYSLAYVLFGASAAVNLGASGAINGNFGFGGTSSVVVNNSGDLRVGASLSGTSAFSGVSGTSDPLILRLSLSGVAPMSVSGQADPLTLERNSWNPVPSPSGSWGAVVVPSVTWQPVLPQ